MADSLIDFLLPPRLPPLTVFLSKLNCDLIRSLIEMLQGAALTGGCYSMQRWCLRPFKITSWLLHLFFYLLSFLPVTNTHTSLCYQTLKVLHQIYCNTQWTTRASFCSFLFFFFLSLCGCVSQSLKLDEMYSTSVSLESSVWVREWVSVCMWVRVNVCVTWCWHESHLNQVPVGFQKSTWSSSVFCEFSP